MKTSLFPPNAILFIFDISNESVQIPDYIDGRLISANETCISVGTQAEIDGEVVVSLLDINLALDTNKFQQEFVGSILTPGSKLAIVTAEMDIVLQKDIQRDSTEVSIWVDDFRCPSAVIVTVS